MQSKAIRYSKMTLTFLAAYPIFSVAAPNANSAYFIDQQSSHVEDATSKGISQVNMITCIMNALRPDAMVNQGNYIALVDETKCDQNSRSSASNSSSSSSGSTASSYTTAIVNSSRASNTEPMRSKIWIDEQQDNQSSLILVNTSVSEAPSLTNPYGQFRLDFCGKSAGSQGAPCMFEGFVEGSNGNLSFFQNETGNSGVHTTALKLSSSGTTSGNGALSDVNGGVQTGYTFSYNDSLFLRSDGIADQCFSRDASDSDTGMSVWRYGLYDASTGDRITLNSGFPIDYTTGGNTYHGFLGYWGLSLPPDVNLVNGATIEKVDYNSGSNPTRIAYTVVKADGRLMKYTKRVRTLRELDKIKFTSWIGNDNGVNTADSFFNGATANTQYEMYWDDANSEFKASGMMNCGNNGCQTIDIIGGEKSVPVSYFANRGGMAGWSQALGGEIFIPLAGVGGSINSTAINAIYRAQDLVYPEDMPATLKCLRECPTAATIASFFTNGSSDMSPFTPATFNNFSPTTLGNIVSYTSNTTSGLLLDGANQPITITDRDALQNHPQYQFGVRTGRLFNANDLTNTECAPSSGTYCDYKVNELDTYYVWESGPNNWNQFAAVKDSQGNFLKFDAPLQVDYTVPNDAIKYGSYANKTLVLQYGGFGELWGIPGECVSFKTNLAIGCDSNEARYVPSFSIPFDSTIGRATAGANTYLIKWLDREIRFAKKANSVCTTAGLTLPSGITLPTSAELKDPSNTTSDIYIGEKPTISSAPRVIHGDVKY